MDMDIATRRLSGYILGVNSSQAVSQMVLTTLRQISRAISTRSRELSRTVGLNVPQLLVLREVTDSGEVVIGHVAERVSLSQATVTSIVDRLESLGLVSRRRDDVDRRKVVIASTDAGKAIAADNPTLLQDEFIAAFTKLEAWEQTQILSSLQRVASMMKAQKMAVAAVLSSDAWSEGENDAAAELGATIEP